MPDGSASLLGTRLRTGVRKGHLAESPGSGQELGGDADADEVVALAVEGSQRHAGTGKHGQDVAGGVRVGAGLVDQRWF